MTQQDVLALARAGFTAGQIATIAQSGTGAPAGSYQQNAQTILPWQQPTSQQVVQPTGQQVVQPTGQPTGQQVVQPNTSVTAPSYSTNTMDANSQMLMQAINNLTTTMQANALRTDTMPQAQTAGDVIASIINPPGEIDMPESKIMGTMGQQTMTSGINTTVRGNY